jgi:hypothetical protein
VAAAVAACPAFAHAARAAATPPTPTASIYEPTVAPAALRAQGCGAARAGETGIVILDFGRPAYIGRSRRYGTLDYAGTVVSNGQIEQAMEAFAGGYARCRSETATGTLAVARGTNDSCSNDDPACCPHGCRAEPPSFELAGRRWAMWVQSFYRHLVADRLTPILRATGADDLEPGWNPDYWASAYFALGYELGALPAANHGLHLHLLDYGSLDGSIWTLPRQRQIAAGWFDLPFPEIYVQGQAAQWEALDVWSAQATGARLPIVGVTTQWAASEPASCGYTPAQGYQALLAELASNPATQAQTSIPFATNFACDRSHPTAGALVPAAGATARGGPVLAYGAGRGIPVPFAASQLAPRDLWLGRLGAFGLAVYSGARPSDGRGLVIVRATEADGGLAWQRRLLAPAGVGAVSLVSVGASGIRVAAAGWRRTYSLTPG